MKQLLGICAGLLLTLAAVLGVFLFFYDYEYLSLIHISEPTRH